VSGSGANLPAEDSTGRAREPTDLAADSEPSADERRDRLRAAAYQAEYATGRRERTATEAKRNIIVRLVLIAVGGVVFLAGLAMLVFPGPGILVSLVGLGILAREFAWADHLMKTLREKSHVDDVGNLPISVQVALGLVSMAAVAASTIWLIWLR
jgi:hypothetical protein